MKECQQAFEELKKYLSSSLPLNKPKSDESLYLYLVVSVVAISAVLVYEQDKLQRSIYYIS